MPRTPPAPGLNIKLAVALYAQCETAGKMHGLSVPQYVEKACQAQLERDRHGYKVNKFNAAKAEARARRQPDPLPQDFGLQPPAG